MTQLQLYSNRLSGTLPAQLSVLETLNLCRLQFNDLTGPVYVATAMYDACVNTLCFRQSLSSRAFPSCCPQTGRAQRFVEHDGAATVFESFDGHYPNRI